MPECSNCGSHIGPSDSTCPSCGAPAPGATASFEPVGGELSTQVPAIEQVDGPVLVVRKGPQPGERFYIDRATLTLGRDPESDIFLNDMTVSRTHAVLSLQAGVVSVRDAGSLNGTYVNGVCADSAALHEGDVLQIGTFQMVYHGSEG